jgi:hypothetical protein
MKKCYFITYVLIFLCQISIAQQFTKGTILDAENGAPIPFANVFFSNLYKGTSTNESGEFILEISSFPQEITISHISYEKQKIQVQNDKNLTIKLVPLSITLGEVFITGEPDYAFKLVQKAYGKMKKESKKDYYGKVFYRQKTYNDEQCIEVQEKFYEAKFSTQRIEQWKITNARFAEKVGTKVNPIINFTNFSYLGGAFKFFQDKLSEKELAQSLVLPIGESSFDKYDYELKRIIKGKENEIAVIAFTPKQEKKLILMQGELYLDIKNAWIYKIKGIFNLANIGFLRFKDLKDIAENSLLTFEVASNLDKEGNWQIDYFKTTNTFDYVSPSLNLRKKVKAESVLFFYEYDEKLKNRSMKALELEINDLKAMAKLPYNKEFWQNNPIIKRTPLEEDIIKSFEEAKAFGNMFSDN